MPATQVVYASPIAFGPIAVRMTCPNCRYEGFTAVQKIEGRGHSTCCCISCLLGGLPGVCCFYLLCSEDYMDTRHICPRCSAAVGVYEKPAC